MARDIELLSPAKDKNCAISAINFGADAVYIGAPSFGARKNAANTLEDIEDVVKYAHKFFARVYVTLNTILKDDELDDVQDLLHKLYDIGVDGIIVQDFAIFKMDLPPFLISASTQCDIRDIEKVKFFEKLGLDRVILAREMSLEKIREICKNTDIEIETFIHGALCVSYSGQCYLSYAFGNRSANRGECAQPCRKRYTLFDDCGNVYVKNKHLLSLKDFCAAPYLDELVNAGVISFKIEGRLKDENYVKNVSAFYNILLEKYNRISSGKVFYDFKPDINKTFNREYSTYFLCSGTENIYNFETPKQKGEKAGIVIGVEKDFIKVRATVKINPQDGMSYFYNDDLSGFLVNKVIYKNDVAQIYPNSMPKIKSGMEIFRNFDFEFNKNLANSKTKRRIGVKFFVYNCKIEVLDEDNIKYFVPLNGFEEAQNVEKMKSVFQDQLNKTGNSDFYVQDITFVNSKIPFLKVSQINAIRRELLDKLMEFRLKFYEQERLARKAKRIIPAKFPLKYNDYRLNVHNQKAKEFYAQCNVQCAQPSYETKNIKNAELMRTKHCLRRTLNMCLKSGIKNKKLYLTDEKGKRLKLEFDCKNCEMVIKEY